MKLKTSDIEVNDVLKFEVNKQTYIKEKKTLGA
jgi:hypothetical protein